MVKGKYRPWVVVSALVLVVLAFVAGVQFQARYFAPRIAAYGDTLLAGMAGSGSAAVPRVDDISLRPVETFQEVLSLLRRNYVEGISAKEEQQMGYAAVRGMLTTLNDPFTRFLDPEEFRGFMDESQGHFDGIGATLELMETPDPHAAEKTKDTTAAKTPFQCKICGADWENPVTYKVTRASAHGFEAEYVAGPPTYRQYRITVVSPIAGGPAEKAGIKAADQIVKIDNASTFGMGIADAVKRIKGPAGTSVSIMIARKGSPKPIEFKLVRGKITIPTVEKKMLDSNVGYIKLNSFNENSATMMAAALSDLRSKGMKSLIFDLRNNPGGSLEACLQIASMFVPYGPIVNIQQKGAKPEPRMAPKSARGLGLPVVTLINRGSASASEILAGALQDRSTGKLVGERSFGKGLVQTVLSLPDGSGILITTAKYLTPNLHQVNGKGILPDKDVEQPDGVIEPLSDKDLQFKAALQLAKAGMAQPAMASNKHIQWIAPVPAH